MKHRIKSIALLMAMAASAGSIFLSQTIMQLAAGVKENMMSMTAGTAACYTTLTVLAVILFYRGTEDKEDKDSTKNSAERKKRIKKTAGNLLVMMAVWLTGILMVSLLNGILAVVLQSVLKQSLGLAQIKDIIHCTGTVLTLVVMPILIRVFWAKSQDRRLDKHLFQPQNTYRKLLILCLLLFAAGLIITALCNNITRPDIGQTATWILLTAAGYGGIVMSEEICTKEPGGRK